MLSGDPPQLRWTCMSPAYQPAAARCRLLLWVVNVQMKSAARGLPATSVTPPVPPLIVAV